MDTHEDEVQADLNKLQIWADQWGMQFNTTKCYVMHIMTPHQRKEAVSIPYQMQGVELEARGCEEHQVPRRNNQR